MKKFISWLCIIATFLLLFFYAVSSASEGTEGTQKPSDVYAVLAQARYLISNNDDGLEMLVRNGTSLLSKGVAWEPLARKKLREAAQKAFQIESLVAPYIPPHGVSTLRYMNLGLGDHVLQKIEYMPYSRDFSSRIPSPTAPARGEITHGPILQDGRIFWFVHFPLMQFGWLPEDVLTKEFPHPPLLIATACWIKGNALTYKMVATLRSYQNDSLTGEQNATIKDMLNSILAAYECALGMYALPESIASLGTEEAARYREIIKKNFPIIQEQQRQAQKKSSDARIGPEEEMEIARAILGDENTRAKNSRQTVLGDENTRQKYSGQTVMIPIPQREADPDRTFSPGIPIGVH